MPILEFNGSFTGFADVVPNFVFIQTNDTVATVTTAGYLTPIVQERLVNGLKNTDLALVSTQTTPNNPATASVAWYQISITGLPGNFVYSLTAPAIPGPAVIAGGLVVDGGVVALGNVDAGQNGFAGELISFPATLNNGSLVIAATNSPGDVTGFVTTITNAPLGQSTTFTIPDPGVAAASFLLNAGPGNLVTDYQQMTELKDFSLAPGGGAFTIASSAQGNWEWLHTTAADTSLFSIDITEQLRAAAGRGFELVSFDVIYSIGTLAVTSNAVTLSTTVYANNVAVAVTNVAITGGALATAVQANPYVTNVTVNAPAFNNPAAGTAVKQVIEITVINVATSVYTFRGINLRFTKSIS